MADPGLEARLRENYGRAHLLANAPNQGDGRARGGNGFTATLSDANFARTQQLSS